MLLRLSKNAFVRQYGPFTYVLERIHAYDEMFVDAEVFMRWITRKAMPKGGGKKQLGASIQDVGAAYGMWRIEPFDKRRDADCFTR